MAYWATASYCGWRPQYGLVRIDVKVFVVVHGKQVHFLPACRGGWSQGTIGPKCLLTMMELHFKRRDKRSMLCFVRDKCDKSNAATAISKMETDS